MGIESVYSTSCLNFSWISLYSTSIFCLIGSFPCDGDYVPSNYVSKIHNRRRQTPRTSNLIWDSLNMRSDAESRIFEKVTSPDATAFCAASWNATKLRSIALVL